MAEVKLLAGKAVVKGELRVQCAWRAEGDTALQSQAAALPFQQVIDLEGITEDCRCLCVAEPVGFTLSQAESAAAQLTANVMLHLRACFVHYGLSRPSKKGRAGCLPPKQW